MRRLVLIGEDPEFANQLAAATAGLCEVVRAEDGPQSIDHDQGGLVAVNGSAAPARMHLFLRALPGGGTTATELAVLRAQEAGEALLIDCTLPMSIAAAALDLDPGYGGMDAMRDLDRIDRLLLSSALACHAPSGLRLLPLASADAASQLSPDSLLTLVSRLRAFFGEVIVDTGGIRHAGLLQSLAASATHIHLLCPQTLPGVLGARAVLDMIGDGAARVVLTVEDHDPAILLSPRQMSETLGLNQIAVLPEARAAQANALNAGEPLVLANPASAYARAMASLAGRSRPDAAAPSLLDRLMGRAQ